jgi:excinuclease ABC subunit A
VELPAGMPPTTSSKTIRITHARLHNLKNINLEIPRQQLVAITGVSGSGKSTLAFDLIYEQGRRRYLQAIGMLSDLVEDTGCERITGLGPTIAVQQGIIRQSNPRSSVGTRTGIFALLRLLYVYEGQLICPGCGQTRRASAACLDCAQAAQNLHSGFFSYNSPLGMCLRCQGRGHLFELNMEKLLPAPTTTTRQMLANAGSLSTFSYLLKGMLKDVADMPFSAAPESARQHLLYGIPVGDGRVSHNLFDHLRWKLLKGRAVDDCIRFNPCPDCGGSRISQEARQVTLLGRHIGQVSELPLADLEAFLGDFISQSGVTALARNLVDEINHRLHSLRQNGLAHLTLYRDLPSLSGGELQRLFLSSHIDAQIDSLIYVLDEPTVGLHELEKMHLLEQLRVLQAQGNTILLVEHDPHLIAAADTIVDIGPWAGSAGGELVYQGEYAGLLTAPRSVTGQYLSGRAALPRRQPLPMLPSKPHLRLFNGSTHNLQSIEVRIPLGCLVGVAGVSGSGKSSLVMKTLVPLLDRHFVRRPAAENEEAEIDLAEDQSAFFSGQLEGVENLCGFCAVTQQPIGRHDNSNPATYLKIWDPIRKLFASTPEAQALDLTPGDFSFNAGGACPTCSGSGKQRLWLGGNFFTTQLCPECKGKRFREDILRVHWRGHCVLEVLEMPAAQACEFFSAVPAITRVLEVLERSGMGYLPLGQPAPTLSGGEAQRIKLAYEISRAGKNQTLYILDEPTIGLSLYDTGRLLLLLDELVRKGNSLLVIEHDPVVLSRCDWIIELGPGGGRDGGRLIATGTPSGLRSNPSSLIGPFLND